jgi:hypothetical protein
MYEKNEKIVAIYSFNDKIEMLTPDIFFKKQEENDIPFAEGSFHSHIRGIGLGDSFDSRKIPEGLVG